MTNAQGQIKRWYGGIARRREFYFVRELLKQYPHANVYVVGGVLRDVLLNRQSKDYDFVVTGLPERTLLRFLKSRGKVNLVGKTFGVFKFTPTGLVGVELDIALPRIDEPGTGSGAYRDVVVVSRHDVPIEDDLLRRDFTMNALAWNVRTQQLIDVVGGVRDIEDNKIRTVGEPARRFAEDYSRMLRGLRFAAVLGATIERATWQAIRANISHLNKQISGEYVVPREVIGLEFVKSFYVAPLSTIDFYEKSGALEVLIPEVLAMRRCPQPKEYHTEGDVWQHSMMAVQALYSRRFKNKYSENPDAELLLAVFLHDIGKPPTLRTPKRDKVDRVRFDGHDVVGARMAREIIGRLKLFSAPANSPLHVDADNVAWLIKNHLLLLNDNARQMRSTTIEKYFVAHPMAVKLQQLMLADTLASVPKSGRPVVRHLVTLEKVLKKLPRTSKNTLPPPLLSGTEIMRILHVSAGPRIGELLQQLREAQLAGKVTNKVTAKQFIKTL